MVAQAQAELPNECCGFLAGSWEEEAGARLVRAIARYPLVNEAAQPQIEYHAERSLFPAVRAIDCAGLQIVAIYHSHPTSDPIPSRKDRERNYYGPDVIHIIISLINNDPKTRAWRITEHGALEVEIAGT
jgi:proteasome lid subunit RPN8/RPN11